MAASISSRQNVSVGSLKGEIVLVDMGGDASYAFNSSLSLIRSVQITPRDTATCTEAPAYAVSGNQVTVYVAIADDPDLDIVILGE